MKTNQILALPPGPGQNTPVARYYLENAWPANAQQEWELTYEAIQR